MGTPFWEVNATLHSSTMINEKLCYFTASGMKKKRFVMILLRRNKAGNKDLKNCKLASNNFNKITIPRRTRSETDTYIRAYPGF